MRVPFRRHRKGSRRVAAVLAFLLAVLVVGVPAGVWAAHQFSDVSNSHPFHSEISAVAGAGITRGFADGRFRPADNITRQAAAAFFERGLGRVSSRVPSDTQLGNASHLPRTAQVASVAMDAGAAGGGNGFVHLQADLMAYVHQSFAASCPCDVEFYLTRDGNIVVGDWHYVVLQGSTGNISYLIENGGLNATVQLPADSSASFQLYARLLDTDVGQVGVSGQLTATYIPFGPDGDGTLDYEHTCTGSESENNDTQGTADAIPASGCIRGRLSNASDVDFFAVGVSSGQVLRAATGSPEGAGCNGDTFLQVLDFSGTVVASDQDAGAGGCSSLVRSGLATGTYFLRVNSSQGAGFDYRLEASVSAAAGAQPPAASGDEGAGIDGTDGSDGSGERLAPPD